MSSFEANAIWGGPPQRIDRVLVDMKLARSRVLATEMIDSGRVLIDQRGAKKPSTKVVSGQKVSVHGLSNDVGRGAQKLRHAIAEFQINAQGSLALDVGASTGGFTQVLLEEGASEVIALDVGHDQLAKQLREHPRVTVVEGCNARYLTAEKLFGLANVDRLPDLIVSDVSFISITQLFSAFKKIMHPKTKIIVLVKPQFEVGREHIGDGVVRDTALHKMALKRVIAEALATGFAVQNIINSPVLGSLGNVEFLMHLSNVNSSEFTLGLEDQSEWDERINKMLKMGASVDQ
ncbi:MAG TPA: TlyA family RNA methyltransferase [Microbacteriaceae bacterium]|nr:TlyA family RNA methyltransferase [Microbacteriaceae bacterium]